MPSNWLLMIFNFWKKSEMTAWYKNLRKLQYNTNNIF